MKFLTNNPGQTKKLGHLLAKEILGKRGSRNKFLKQEPVFKEQAFVIGLVGELGGGKTTFLQGLAKGLGVKEKILSPTFIIVRKFSIAEFGKAERGGRRIKDSAIFNFQFSNFYHLDCYRIENSKELLNLGFKEIISDSQNIVAIEWADRIKEVLPKNTIWINFKFISKEKRQLIVKLK